MLSDLPTLKQTLRITNDVSQDQYLASLLTIADAGFKAWCKRDFETRPYAYEYQNGSGSEYLILKHRPVWSVQEIRMDPGGFGGQAVNAFPANSVLVAGTDYMLQIDSSIYYRSNSGIVRRMGGGLTSTIAYMPWNWRRGSLTAKLNPPWPVGFGNIRIAYTAGYGVGAAAPPNGVLPVGTTLPAELTQCVNIIAAYWRNMMPVGVPVDIDRQAGAVNDLLSKTMAGDGPPQLGSVVQMARKYREVAM